MSNHKQFGLAVSMYVEDNEYYPPGRQAGVTQWDLTLGRYVGGKDDVSSPDARTELFACPSARIPNLGIRLNYSANPNVFKEITAATGQLKAEAVKRTSEIILVADSIQYTSSGNSHAIFWGIFGSAGAPIYWNDGAVADGGLAIQPSPDKDEPPLAPGNVSGSNIRYRHANATAIASFADGHAERIRKGKVVDRNLYTNY